MALFMGIDGGGTGCRAAVCDAAGRRLGEAAGGPANITSDVATARANILAAARAALPAAADLTGVTAVMGLAGANVAGVVAEFRQGLPFARVRIVTDAVTAVAGALGESDGVVAAIGTGSVFAMQRAGRFTQIGGWGAVLGDEGSAAWLGRALLARCLRAFDGFAPMTPLLTATLDECGGPDGAVAFARDASPAAFGTLAPRLTDSDDPSAKAIMAAGEAEVAAAIALLQGTAPLPVVFLGGLGPVYAARLDGRWPVAQPRGSALDGALWLARRTDW